MPDPKSAEQEWRTSIEESLSYIAKFMEQLNEQMTELRRHIEGAYIGGASAVDLGYDDPNDRPLR